MRSAPLIHFISLIASKTGQSLSIGRTNSIISRSAFQPSHKTSVARQSKHKMNQLVQDDNVDNMILHGPELPPIAKGHKRLFLVRHGEVINPGGDKAVFYGALDVPLSELGKDEARAAGAYLHQFDLQHVAASPLSRAIFGAEEVIKRQLKDPSSKVKVYNGFTELDRGSWAMKTKEEIGIENLKRFDACDESITPDNGESYPQLKARVLMARDELLSITDDGRASAIVSHLQVTRSMLSDALRIPIKEMSKLKIATASITCIDYNIATGEQMIHFQSFKPEAGLEKAMDGAN